LFWIISVVSAVLFFIIGSAIMIWGLDKAVNG